MDREDMDDETKSFLSARFVFEPDGLFKIVMAIPDGVPQEKIDQAAAAGEIRLFDSRSMNRGGASLEGGKRKVLLRFRDPG